MPFTGFILDAKDLPLYPQKDFRFFSKSGEEIFFPFNEWGFMREMKQARKFSSDRIGDNPVILDVQSLAEDVIIFSDETVDIIKKVIQDDQNTLNGGIFLLD